VFTTQPLDVVKTKMQSLGASKLYRNTLHCLITVAKKDGIPALWKGSTPRLGRLVFSGGIVFSVYEKILQLYDSLA
jgi:solute carrier family 25 citrate transporter 1